MDQVSVCLALGCFINVRFPETIFVGLEGEDDAVRPHPADVDATIRGIRWAGEIFPGEELLHELHRREVT